MTQINPDDLDAELTNEADPVVLYRKKLEQEHEKTVHGRNCDDYELDYIEEPGRDDVTFHCANCNVVLHRGLGGDDGE